MVRRWNPRIVFLSETKSKTRHMERIKNKIGFANGLLVPSNGRSGGLALLWSRKVDLEIKSYTKNHIDAVVIETDNGFKWRVTGFYGHLDTHKRYESWNFLAFLHNQFQLLWLCFGDFNKILFMEEKFGGVTRSQQQMSSFRNVVDYCGFQDLGYHGLDFT